jgi:hypothetical protein
MIIVIGGLVIRHQTGKDAGNPNGQPRRRIPPRGCSRLGTYAMTCQFIPAFCLDSLIDRISLFTEPFASLAHENGTLARPQA